MSGFIGQTGTDIALVWDPANARADWQMADGDLLKGAGTALETAVLLSLFTDRLASPDFVPTDGTNDRRGWWGDSYNRYPIGSRFWQFERAKKADANAILLQARDFGEEALQWLIDDGVAASVTVTPSWIRPNVLGVIIVIVRPLGTATTFRYAWAWNGMAT